MYDSLGRLIRAKNPEQDAGSVASNVTDTVTGNGQWSMAYGYDNNGNLTARVDARNITTNYGYDALNRNISVTYSDGTTPAVYRYYDSATNGRGRLYWDQAVGVSANVFDAYDAVGRPTQYHQRFWVNGAWGQYFNITRTHDYAGHVITQTNPSGHTVNYAYDIAGRINNYTGNLGDGLTRTYATAVTYSEFGGLQQEQFGTQTPLYHKLHYNARGQLYDIRLSTYSLQANEFDWNRGCLAFYYGGYTWGQSGPLNNGNLSQQQHWVPANDAFTDYGYTEDHYSYDSLNRLATTNETHGGPWGVSAQDYIQTYAYDRFGNRTINQSQTSTNVPHPNYTIDPNTNRLIAPAGYNYTYDQAGNQTNDNYTGEGQRTYDGEQRLKQAWANNQWQTYTYDADGRRVRRNVNGVETWQVYGLDGELLAEYAASASPASPQKEYGYRDGQLLITADVTTGIPAPTFSDDFNDNSLDTAKWSVVDPNSPAIVSETGQRLQITLQPNTAAYNGVYSNSTFDITNKTVQVEAAQPISQAGWCENFMEVVLDGNNYFLIDSGAGSMVFRSMVGGVNDQTVLQIFDPAIEHYWRIRHDPTANTINFETSADNSSWTTRKTAAVGFSLASLRFYLYAGAWGTGNGSPGAAKYDNFQLVGNTPSTVVNIQWLVTDQLGTPRMVVDKSGSLANVKRHDYLPFGEELFAGTGGRTAAQGYSASDGIRQKWAGKEQDNETGLDYFIARYYSSTQGRFTGTDPLGGHILNPQSLNKYVYVINNPLRLTDPSGMYVCGDSTDKNKCSSKEDTEFEKARQRDLKSKDPDVLRAAKAYGDPNTDNHVTVSFADLDKKGEGGVTTSTLGADDQGKLYAKSDVVINSNLSGSALDAAVGHEGSHVSDAQGVVSSIVITDMEKGTYKVGQDITRYQSEQRAYRVTDSILRAGNESYHFGCGVLGDCILGTELKMRAQVPETIDRLLANSPLYRDNGKPLSPKNQGGSVVNGLVVPH